MFGFGGNDKKAQQQAAIDQSNALLNEMDVAEENNDMPKILELSEKHIASCWKMKEVGCTVRYTNRGEAYWSTQS